MKIVFCLLLLISSSLSAAWEEAWTDAVTACHEKRYEDAKRLFTSAIDKLEDDPEHAHVYIDRGRLYLLLGENEKALSDIEKGLKGTLKGDDKLRAIVSKVTVLYRLGQYDEAEECQKILLELQPAPRLEVYKSIVIIRNIPDCGCAHEILKRFVASTFCNSLEDVTIENGMCIAKRTKACPQENLKTKTLTNHKALTECDYWCNRLHQTCSIFCTTKFQSFRCQAICIATVDTIAEGCHWCCKGGGFYKSCVKPFEDVVGSMGNVCDPAWD